MPASASHAKFLGIYTHYADKQDLFLSDVEEFLEGMGSSLDRCHAPAVRLAALPEN